MMILGILMMVVTSVFSSLMTAIHYDHVCSPALSPAQVAVGYLKEDDQAGYDEIADDITVRQQWLRSSAEAPDVYRVAVSGVLQQPDVRAVTYVYEIDYRDGGLDVRTQATQWTCADGRTADDRAVCAH